jgi:hypothetical protein
VNRSALSVTSYVPSIPGEVSLTATRNSCDHSSLVSDAARSARSCALERPVTST